MCVRLIVKYILFFANVAFCLAGVVLLGLGITILVHLRDIEILQQAPIRAIPISIVVLGAVISFVACFGCCGAIKDSRCFLMMFSVTMILLAGGKMYLVVVVFRGLSNIQELIEDWIGTAFNDPTMRNAFHVMEAAFQCCGTSGPNSYEGILPELPWSCCAMPRPDFTCSRINAFVGCDDRIGRYFESYGYAIVGVVITVIVIEVVAFAFGIFLCHSIRNKPRVRTA